MLHLAHARFENTGLDGVLDSALGEIKTVVAVCLLLGDGFFFFIGVTFLETLGYGMADSELRNEL